MGNSRIIGIDVFRLIAAFSIIFVHVGTYSSLPLIVGVELRLLARWAVPFFFIVSGYFAAPYVVSKHERLTDISARMLAVFFVANIIFLPLRVHQEGVGSTLHKVLSLNLIFGGLAGHLWFISSFSIAMLVFYMLRSYDAHKMTKILVALSLIVLVFVAYHPGYRSSWEFARYITSFPFIYMGMVFRLKNIKLGVKFSVLLIFFGIASQNLEAYLLYRAFEANPLLHNFLLGTIPFSIGMFLLALEIPDSTKARRFAAVGAKYSLGIYIFHPYFIYLLESIDLKNSVVSEAVFQVAIVPLCFALTLLSIILLNRFFPCLLKLVSGDSRTIKQADALIPLPAALKMSDKSII
ncbi:MAG: acyltransferase [Cyanobacteria bacterium P01_D01_bin.105]